MGCHPERKSNTSYWGCGPVNLRTNPHDEKDRPFGGGFPQSFSAAVVKLCLICHQVSDAWCLFSSSCSFPRHGRFSQSAWLQLSWRPLQPSDSPCPWWGPSFTVGAASWLTAASLMPSATPASPTSVLLTPRASTWVHKMLIWSFLFSASWNSWPLSGPHGHNRQVWLHLMAGVCLLFVFLHWVWVRERLWGWVSAFFCHLVSHALQPVAEMLTWPCRPSSGFVLLQCATDGLSNRLSLTAAVAHQHNFGILARLEVLSLLVKWPLPCAGLYLGKWRSHCTFIQSRHWIRAEWDCTHSLCKHLIRQLCNPLTANVFTFHFFTWYDRVKGGRCDLIQSWIADCGTVFTVCSSSTVIESCGHPSRMLSDCQIHKYTGGPLQEVSIFGICTLLKKHLIQDLMKFKITWGFMTCWSALTVGTQKKGKHSLL